MQNVQIQPMEWSSTKDIDEVEPFTDADAECFRELRDVLVKHNALDRFGVTLIHSHFPIAEDEEMVEFTDHENRTLITKPVKRSEIEENQFTATNWKLAEGETIAMRVCVCARTSNGHTGGHAAV